MSQIGLERRRRRTIEMNRYRAMTYVLVVSNIFVLVAMFIAAFWGFTYPNITVDGYESGKSAYVAAFMCGLASICLCGLNFQNYYLLVTYAVLHLVIMLNQLFNLLPFNWTRIPNYPLTGNVSTQIYITIAPKILMVSFAFAIAFKLRHDEKRYELASTGGLHQRLPCHIVPRSACDQPIGSIYHQDPTIGGGGGVGSQQQQQPQQQSIPYGANDRGQLNGIQQQQTNNPQQQQPISQQASNQVSSSTSNLIGNNINNNTINTSNHSPPRTQAQQPPPPPPTLPTPPHHPQSQAPPPLPPPSSHHSHPHQNQIIQTPPIYPLHRPNVTDIGGGMQTSPPPPPPLPPLAQSSLMCHRTSLSGNVPTTPTKWWPNSAKQYQQYLPYYRDVYNPNF
ncbi:hypothetical protein BLOT_010512 [Blomia tropicalis]|nr:hypothetical protein BLOT_010512 [Blomia tropicalis]